MELKERKDAKQKELEGTIKKIQETTNWQNTLNTKAVELQGQIKLLDEMMNPPKDKPKEK